MRVRGRETGGLGGELLILLRFGDGECACGGVGL